MLTRDDFAAWIRPCPDNGVSHDCSHEYVMWMPVELLDTVLERQNPEVVRQGDPMTETKEFHLGDILTITTGMLVSPDHIGGAYNILNWMTGDNLFTHQLPRASRECEGPLLEQHPQLADVQVPEFEPGTRDEMELAVMTWLASQTAIYGERLPVAKLAKEQHTEIDPIAEIKMIRPDMPIVAVEI